MGFGTRAPAPQVKFKPLGRRGMQWPRVAGMICDAIVEACEQQHFAC